MNGFVSLVGAGPGDPELLTQRAVKRLASADLVLYDGLVPDEMLQLAPRATCVSVAKRAGGNHLSQDWINNEMIEAARGGLFVVRFKAGDPFVLGRGGEEALALAEAGVPFEVVPGVSSAIGGPALAGIPVTHRGLSSGFVVVSGHAPQAYEGLIRSLEPGSATVVVLMGIKARGTIAAHLIARGWDPQTPVAIVNSASQPDQHTWIGVLHNLDQYPADLAGDAPGVIVIGQVVSLRAKIARQLALSPRANALGRGPNALGPRPNALGSRPNALGPRPNALGPRPNALGPTDLLEESSWQSTTRRER